MSRGSEPPNTRAGVRGINGKGFDLCVVLVGLLGASGWPLCEIGSGAKWVFYSSKAILAIALFKTFHLHAQFCGGIKY